MLEIVTVTHEAFKRKGMYVNVSKTKVMVIDRVEVKELMYLGNLLTRDVRVKVILNGK